jgi:hypothetical protein
MVEGGPYTRLRDSREGEELSSKNVVTPPSVFILPFPISLALWFYQERYDNFPYLVHCGAGGFHRMSRNLPPGLLLRAIHQHARAVASTRSSWSLSLQCS